MERLKPKFRELFLVSYLSLIEVELVVFLGLFEVVLLKLKLVELEIFDGILVLRNSWNLMRQLLSVGVSCWRFEHLWGDFGHISMDFLLWVDDQLGKMLWNLLADIGARLEC